MHGPYAAAKTRDLWTRSREAVLNDGPLFHASTKCQAGWVGNGGYPGSINIQLGGAANTDIMLHLNPLARSLSQLLLLLTKWVYLHAPFTFESHFSQCAHAVRVMWVVDRPTGRPAGDKTNLNRRSFVPRLPLTYCSRLILLAPASNIRLLNTLSDQRELVVPNPNWYVIWKINIR